MTYGLSALGYLGVGKETTYGTAVSVTKYIPILSEDITPTSGVILPEEIKGSRARETALEGDFTIEGDIEFNGAAENGLGEMLIGALGSCSTSGTASPYVHTFTGKDTLPSYTVEINTGNVMKRIIPGCKVGVLTIGCSVGEPLTVTSTLTGKTENIATSGFGSPSYSTVRAFVGGDASITLGGTASARVENFEVVIDNSLIKDYKTLGGTRTIKDLPEGRRAITGSMDLGFEAVDVYKWFLGGGTAPQTEGTTVAIEVTWTGTSFGGTAYTLKIELPKCRIRTEGANISDADRVVEGVEFDALWDSSSTADVKVTLTNSEASY